MVTAPLLTHAPVIVQLPTMSPPQGATLPQLPPPLLPHVDSNGAATIENRTMPRRAAIVMRTSVAPAAVTGK
jgi:biopolymer transport protein ExbD